MGFGFFRAVSCCIFFRTDPGMAALTETEGRWEGKSLRR